METNYDFKNFWEYKQSRVLVLDMDHTIIGDNSILAEMDFMIQNFSWKIDKKPPIINSEEIVKHLNDGLLRPGFIEFIKNVRENQGYLVIIYTASVKSWAKRFLDGICSIVGYRFYCMLLARDYCIQPDYSKSLFIVQHELRKLNIVRKVADFIMIDNNRVMIDPRLKLAPDYNYQPIVSVLSRVSVNNMVYMDEKQMVFNIFQKYNKKYNSFRNKQCLNDTFFKTLKV